jgi:hypothetical protein
MEPAAWSKITRTAARCARKRVRFTECWTPVTVEELRGCIDVPPKVERTFRIYAAMNSAEARWVEKILMFRNFVAQ